MASIEIKAIHSWLKGGEHYATSWKASLSSDPEDDEGVIEVSLKDTLHKDKWEPMLPVIGGGEGEYYHNLDEFFIHFKLHYRDVLVGAKKDPSTGEGVPVYEEDETPWVTSPKLSQRDYDIVVTQAGEPILSTNSNQTNQDDRAWVVDNVTNIREGVYYGNNRK